MTDPHGDAPVERWGADPADAHHGLVLVHGRGATPASMRPLTAQLPPGIAVVAPAAADRTWYPAPFTAPRTRNQPQLGSALARLGAVLDSLGDAGLDREHVTLAGFSQGACLALEYAASHPARYGGVFGFSGGLIGAELPDYDGDLAGTPVFIGCAEADPHIPLARVEASRRVFDRLGADLTVETWPGEDHTITDSEQARFRTHLADRV